MNETQSSHEKTFLLDLYQRFEKFSLTYVFRGIFVPSLTDKILSLAEMNMILFDEASKKQKKVYFVMVESLQNITRHQDIGQDQPNKAFFVIQKKNEKYGLASGNVVENDSIDSLKSKIDHINSLDPDALKEHYKDVLENTGLSEKGGAGLGLIEIARKSCSKLSYSFKYLNDKLSYFYFKTRINLEVSDEPISNLAGTKELHEFTIANKINLIYQGYFNHENLSNLLTMVEGSVENANENFKKKSGSIMIELLQNICNHGSKITPENLGVPGIVVVSSDSNGCKIMSGNYISNETISNFKTKMEAVNASSEQELEDLYSETIMKEHVPGQKGAGLGFIDLRMKNTGKIDYSIFDYNGNFSFLSITVSIAF